MFGYNCNYKTNKNLQRVVAMKIVNKRKFIRSLSIVLFISIIIIAGFKTSYSNTKTQYKEKYVYSGDTLWSIAYKESSSNDYYRGKDIRFIIKDLKDINHLEDANLNDGQKLLIPEI